MPSTNIDQRNRGAQAGAMVQADPGVVCIEGFDEHLGKNQRGERKVFF